MAALLGLPLVTQSSVYTAGSLACDVFLFLPQSQGWVIPLRGTLSKHSSVPKSGVRRSVPLSHTLDPLGMFWDGVLASFSGRIDCLSVVRYLVWQWCCYFVGRPIGSFTKHIQCKLLSFHFLLLIYLFWEKKITFYLSQLWSFWWMCVWNLWGLVPPNNFKSYWSKWSSQMWQSTFVLMNFIINSFDSFFGQRDATRWCPSFTFV